MKTFTNLKNIKIGNHTFTIRDGTSDFKAIKEVIIDKAYQKKEFKPEPGENWIDIGANCGSFCVWAASLGATVEAFEPDFENASIAEANISQNKFSKQVKIYIEGVTESETEGYALLHRNTANGNLWRNSMYKKWRGGESIKIKTRPVKEFWKENNCIKLDAEGVEMPILEKYAEIKVKKLVFEWSFDIDNSIIRFEGLIRRLKKIYKNVVFAGYSSGYDQWQPSWFPACRTIWCY